MDEPLDTGETDDDASDTSGVSRRKFLRTCGLAAAGLVLTEGSMRANSWASSSGPRAESVTFADVSQGAEISGLVGEITPNEQLVFPAGRYTWSEEVNVTANDWGIWCQEDTVFDVPDGMGDGEEAELLGTRVEERVADNFHLNNLTFDSSGRSAPGLHVGVRNQASVTNLEYRMDGPLSDGQQENGIKAYVRNPDGQLRISNYRQWNNGDLGTTGDGDGRIGIWVGPQHRGRIHLRNPVLQGFPNNACYVSSQPGDVRIDGGLLTNNNVSAVRVSGGVEVSGTTIYIDTDRYLDGEGVISGFRHNTRGLWGDNRGAGTDGGLATGVSLIVRSYERSTGLATIVENPQMTLAECQLFLGADIEGVSAADEEIILRNCDFDGTSSNATAGTGTLTGSGNNVMPTINPGTVPGVSRGNYQFDWVATHPETPSRESMLY